MTEDFLLGNGAIALGLLEAGCQMVTSYPGTPSSEILPEVVRLKKADNLKTYVEWSTNEKVALDNAFAAAITGKRTACCMKRPRAATSFTASANDNAPAAVRAEYSPRLCPAIAVGCGPP